MGVTLTITVAGATSNSYATVAEADTYLAARRDAAWDKHGIDEKERRLIQAARIIDRFPFIGYKYDTSTQTAGQHPGQAMAFPRYDDTDHAGDPFIHKAVKNAQIEVAYQLCIGSDSGGFGGGLKSLKIGSVSMSLGDVQSTIDGVVQEWLRPWLATTVDMK